MHALDSFGLAVWIWIVTAFSLLMTCLLSLQNEVFVVLSRVDSNLYCTYHMSFND